MSSLQRPELGFATNSFAVCKLRLRPLPRLGFSHDFCAPAGAEVCDKQLRCFHADWVPEPEQRDA